MSALQVLISRGPVAGTFEVAVFERQFDIVEDHGVELLDACRGFQQRAAHFSRTDDRDVFVFGDGLDFIIVEFAKIQTVFQANHVNLQSVKLH